MTKSFKNQHFMEDFLASDDTALVQEIYRRSDKDTRLTKSQAAQVEFLTNVRCIEQYLIPEAKFDRYGKYSRYDGSETFEATYYKMSIK